MLREAIFHEASGAYAYPISKDILLIQLRAARDDLKEVQLIYGDRYKGADAVEQLTMFKYASDQLFDYFRAEVQVMTRRFRYHFLLDDGKERYWYNEFGFSIQRPMGYHSGYFQYPYITDKDFFEVPDWAKDAIVYQIFPDRFYNGDKSNDPEECKEWGEKPTSEMDFFGGDLSGILAKLSYLEKLGINILYLTPIFESPTSHKYDTTDYYKIDPHFGDKRIFRQLVEECHKRGIRVILDAVFNHCGYNFYQFQDVVKRGEESPYTEWFYIDSFPVTTEPLNYEVFASTVWNMPKLKTANSDVREFLLQVGEYWIREFDIDGWRLDVANEVDHLFWRAFRDRMRAIKHDVYIIGETWHHSGSYLQGDQFDGVMNYHFTDAVLRFCGEKSLSVSEFNERLTRNRVTYRKQAVEANWNLFGSHDTARVLTRLKGDTKAFKLAITFQMTYLGVPFIFAGDELGVIGENDPNCRKCMPWDEKDQDQELLNHHCKMIQLRRKYEALRRGDFRTVFMDEATGLFIFERLTEGDKVIVIINNGLKDQDVEIDLESFDLNPEKPIYELMNDLKLEPDQGLVIVNVKFGEAAILT
ncbi:MAG: glycoside hydrolase family 13 protein [Halanaerobiales bacterium]|nr:glycoside hydrolase family 13 protein [Halanaerobiales bacterium]